MIGFGAVKLYSPEEAEIINTSGLRLEDYKVIDGVNRFVASEAQACRFANQASISDSNSGLSTLSSKSMSMNNVEEKSMGNDNDIDKQD
ncbi:hypothetical protein J3B02_005602, partial [Coemansia erecta]